MSFKLLFITSHYFYQPTQDALKRLQLPCETAVVPYDNFSHISQVYSQYADQYDACFTSGEIARHAIELAHPHITKPLVEFQISPNALHRDILRVMLDTRNTNLSRIAMDFLIPLDSGFSVADFLKMEDIEPVYADNKVQTQNIGITDSYTIESLVFDRIAELWKNNAIDLVICQYSSIIPKLQAEGIPYRCSFVSDNHLRSLIHDVLVRLELQQLQENHPVIVQIFPRYTSSVTPLQYQQLYGHIQQFVQSNLMECVVQDSGNCCILITSIKLLRFLTDNFQVCRLSAYLESKVDFTILVAYGIGTTVSHAMNNVQLASKEAKILGKPFIVDGKGSLIGPLNSPQHMVVPSSAMSDVSDIAKRCSLSAMTIQKIITILQNTGSDKITTQELASRLNTTVRNANRIMQNLCMGGVAVPVYTQASHSRGRPVQVYSLDFGFLSV